MKIGFWNVKKKSFPRPISDLITSKDLDILLLAETTISANDIIADLKKVRSSTTYYTVNNLNSRIKLITCLDPHYVQNFDVFYKGTYWSIFKFSLPQYPEFNLVGVHFPSKLFWDDLSQSFEAVNMMVKLREYEDRYGDSSILIGDFNMNPYEPGMISTLGFHGMKDKRIVKRKNRKINGEYFKYFYNPMWCYLGDNTVPGTYYYPKSVHNNTIWHTFDQALLRPAVLEKFKSHGIEIVTTVGSQRLYPSKGGAINKAYSDHLPIVLTINK